MDRRDFLKTGLTLGGALGVTGLVARARVADLALIRGFGNDRQGGYGPLSPRASRNTGETLLALPEGFEYNVLGKEGSVMTDGRKTPGAHDGMAAFLVNSQIRLVRNHEVRAKPAPKAAIGSARDTYDLTAGGGTTTLVIDPKSRELISDRVSMSGTLVNCAGGYTPWGTWLTCEETCAGRGLSQVYHKDKEQGGGYEKEHGYIFEVQAHSDRPSRPVPIKAMGRFVHEAVAVDPVTGIVYETEDHKNSGFYRYIPNLPGQLARGGRLQMARVKHKAKVDTRSGQPDGVEYEIDWVDIKDPDPSGAEQNPSLVLEQGLAEGCMVFARLEGIWYGNGHFYLNSTNGGDKKLGQIWRYTPRGDEGVLKLIFESKDAKVLKAPDNLCVSPRGGLVICEDGEAPNHIRGLTPDGLVFDFARNLLKGGDSEFAGSCYSPDGRTLFFNIMYPGHTLAVWGPFERGVL